MLYQLLIILEDINVVSSSQQVCESWLMDCLGVFLISSKG